MRFLTAILLLAATVPSYAQTSVQNTVKYISVNTSGNKGVVQEYDGQQQKGGVQADLEVQALNSNTYLDMAVNGVNGNEVGGYIDLNVGANFAVKGKFMNLTHRVPYLRSGLLTNGVLSEKGYTTLSQSTWTVKLATFTGTQANYDAPIAISNSGANLEIDKMDLHFERAETEAKAIFSFPGSPETTLNAGFWQEREYGTAAIRYNSSQLNIGFIDRNTQDVSLGVNTSIGEGAVSVDYTERNFKDSARQLVVDTTYVRGPASKMGLTDIRFRTGAGAAIPVTAALSARKRTSAVTNFTNNTYMATVAAAYKPLKKLALTAKAYGRTVTTYEDHNFISVKGGTYKWGGTNGPGAAIDQFNLSADVKARYEYSDKLSFKAGYKYENNYRANTSTSSFDSTINYTDQYNVLFPTHSLLNLTARQDTRHTANLGVDVSLPFDIELGAGYSKMMANRAVYNGVSDDRDQADASLVVPLPAKLTLVASVGYLAEKNKRDKIIKMSRHQNSYQTAVEWAGTPKVSAGADYTYEQNSDQADMFNGYQGTNQIHIKGSLYRYENNVIGTHAGWNFAKGLSLMGNGSYTISRGILADNLNTVVATAATTRVIFAPRDIRIARGAVALKYLPAGYKDVTARLGYRRDQWIDKVFKQNSGWVNTVDASVSAKF